MDAQELRNLQEAYMEVYHELDEGYKPLPAGRMARRIAGKSTKSITSYANSMVRGGETPHTTGGQIATQKSDKLGKQAGQMLDVLSQHKPERSKAIAAANRATGEVAKKDPGAAKVLRKYAKKRRGSLPGPGRRDTIGEQADLYDIILSHLLDEGYAETPEAAEVIMVNMSEEWRESILG